MNHDSGDGWVIEYNTIQENRGAGLMAGAHQQVRGQLPAQQRPVRDQRLPTRNKIVGLLVEDNEIVRQQHRRLRGEAIPGCGCSGGIKFWSVNGADVRGNWIHGNQGPALWADTNNNDFLVEGNLIEDNDGEALFYETSYNLVLRDNVLRRNALPAGKAYAARQDNFPIPAVYLSESGGEPRIPARTDKIDIYDNDFTGNWSGITAWENADRFCNSPANTSTDSCTRLVDDPANCVQPAIARPPLYDDCRWKTQRVDIHDNTFTASTPGVGCARRLLQPNGGVIELRDLSGLVAVQGRRDPGGDQHSAAGRVAQQHLRRPVDVRRRCGRQILRGGPVAGGSDRPRRGQHLPRRRRVGLLTGQDGGTDDAWPLRTIRPPLPRREGRRHPPSPPPTSWARAAVRPGRWDWPGVSSR